MTHFFSSFKEGLLLPEIDLTTPESAQAAQRILQERVELLEKKSRTIKALKKLSTDSAQ